MTTHLAINTVAIIIWLLVIITMFKITKDYQMEKKQALQTKKGNK